MPEIDPDTLSRGDAYRLMISLVVPRPIAFVTTVSPAGVVNLAPFSFYNAVSGTPPVIMLGIGRRGGERKDTSRNILETGELCVNVSTSELAEAINLAAGDWPADHSELVPTGLETTPSTVIRPPRLSRAPAALECVLLKAIEEEAIGTTLLLARVVRYHVSDAVLGADGLPDPKKLRPLARLGGDLYAHLGEVFAMQRPKVERGGQAE